MDGVAEYDLGGGIVFEDAFVVYTRAPVTPMTCFTPSLRSLALRITRQLPIHHPEKIKDGLMTKIRSGNPSLPWFFLNASKSVHFCICAAGRPEEALFTTLQRPWCVMELCCVRETDVLEHLLDFAEESLTLPHAPRSLVVAKLLLANEIKVRDGSSRPKPRAVKDLLSSLLVPTSQAYMAFRLRAICVCSLFYGIGARELGSVMVDAAANLPTSVSIRYALNHDETFDLERLYAHVIRVVTHDVSIFPLS